MFIKKITKSPKITHNYNCSECNERAKYSIQDWWHCYEIDNGGDFNEINDWEGGENYLYCEKCYQQEVY